MEARMAKRKADFKLYDGGSICLFNPASRAARDWWGENVSEDAIWFGQGYAVERRFANDIVAGFVGEGLSWEVMR
jgi:hypothetical protein